MDSLKGGFDPILVALLKQESSILAQHLSRLDGMFGVFVGRGAFRTAHAVSPSHAIPKFKDIIPANSMKFLQNRHKQIKGLCCKIFISHFKTIIDTFMYHFSR
jgi:hypothetical protein